MKNKLLDFYKRKINCDKLDEKQRYAYQKWRQVLLYNNADFEKMNEAALNAAFDEYFNTSKKPQNFTAVTATVTTEQREKWQQFIAKKNIKSVGTLIKRAVEFYIKNS